jgi:hypothetical protein
VGRDAWLLKVDKTIIYLFSFCGLQLVVVFYVVTCANQRFKVVVTCASFSSVFYTW